jgi:hypothetical protein
MSGTMSGTTQGEAAGEPWREWMPEALVGVVVLGAGLWRTADLHAGWPVVDLLVVVAAAVAVAMSRRAPGEALLVAWLIALVQVLTGGDLLHAALPLAVVGFGCARWGSAGVARLSGFSIPVYAVLCAAIGTALLAARFASGGLFDSVQYGGAGGFARLGYDGAGALLVLPVALLELALLMAPWLVGRALRSSDHSRAGADDQGGADSHDSGHARAARP